MIAYVLVKHRLSGVSELYVRNEESWGYVGSVWSSHCTMCVVGDRWVWLQGPLGIHIREGILTKAPERLGIGPQNLLRRWNNNITRNNQNPNPESLDFTPCKALRTTPVNLQPTTPQKGQYPLTREYTPLDFLGLFLKDEFGAWHGDRRYNTTMRLSCADGSLSNEKM